MILKKIGGKNFLVNALADFILEKLGKDSISKIFVLDCGNFQVIKGETNVKDILDMRKTLDDFREKYSEYVDQKNLTHVFDLIEYDSKVDEEKKYNLTFFNSENCSYHSSQIDFFKSENKSVDFFINPIVLEEKENFYISEFPHGHSLKTGRNVFYFLKRVFYSIPSNYPVVSLTFEYNMEQNDIKVFNESIQRDEILESAFLDSLEFNLSKVEEEMKKVDWSSELTNPLVDYDFLKNVDKLLII